MSMLRSVTVGAVATAMLATSAAPAMAQGYPGGYGGNGYGRPGYGQGYNGYNNGNRGYRQRGHDNTGAIVAGVIGVGILAAIIASASKSNNSNANYGSIRTDNQAADACAVAAERQIGGGARTRSIDTVDQTSGGFNVRGTVSSSSGYDDRGYDNRGYDNRGYDNGARSFSCTVRQGNVQRVDFGGYAYNY